MAKAKTIAKPAKKASANAAAVKQKHPAIPPIAKCTQVLVPLYFGASIKGPSSLSDQEKSATPAEALVFSHIALSGTVTSVGIELALRRGFSRNEAAIIAEEGLLGLHRHKYIKPAAKADTLALEAEMESENWGLGGVRWVITPAGAKRFAALVATLTNSDQVTVKANLVADSKTRAIAYPSPNA